MNENPAGPSASTSRFDEAAAQWDNNPVRVALARAIGSAIERTVALNPSWRVLDYGAGTGLVTLRLQPKVGSVLALDTSTGMLAELTRKLASTGIGNVAVRQWNLEEQPFPEAGFDLAVSSMTMHHVRDVPLVLRRLAQLLKPGGWLAVADLDAEDGSFHQEAQGVFHSGFEREQIRSWFQTAGLSGVKVTDAYQVSKPDAAGQVRAYPVFLATGQTEGAAERGR